MRPEALAELTADAIKRVHAPLATHVKALEAALTEMTRSYLELDAKCRALETRAAVPGPPGPPGPPGDAGKDGAPGLVYRGPHELGKTYEVGDCVYTGGSSWVAVTTTTAAPSTASRDWGLVASRGRDGKREPRP